MTDRELLELAAKAAGIEAWPGVGFQSHMLFTRPAKADLDGRVMGIEWNPLADDGDALRLATRLLIDIGHNHPAEQQRYVVADRRGCEGVFSPISCMEDEFEERDRAAATCRAIVRAAAAIGEAMP